MTRRLAALALCSFCSCAAPAAPIASTPPPPAPPRPAPPPATAVCDVPPTAPEDESRSDFAAREQPARPGDRCAVAQSNLARVEDAILAWPSAPAAARRTPAPSAAGTPAYLDLLTRRFALSAAERTRLTRDGLLVLARLPFTSYGWAFHEIYQSQLPVYISVDALFHAIYAAHDHLLSDLERQRLAPALQELLDALACALPAAPYPPETLADLDLYVTVARALLGGGEAQSVRDDPAVTQAAAALVAQAIQARGLEQVELFGRPRMVDFSQLQPRGHYAGDEARERYFRATMWLMRLELNLVSRSSRSSAPGLTPDPSETPREELLALALADLARRADALAPLGLLERSLGALAGRREDVSVRDLLAMNIDLAGEDAPGRLRAAIGDRFRRTVRMHYMPPGSKELPAIFTLLGPRAVADAAATRPLVHAEVPDRYQLGAGDFAFLLGHDRALALLGGDLARWPELRGRLDAARAIVTAGAGDDLYAAWLGAIRGLAAPVDGVLPSFMTRPAFADLRMSSALAAYAQLRHDNVLITGQPYDEGGCEIPDGWVEPAPAAYRGLIEYARRGATLLPDARPYFERLERVLRILLAIQLRELAGQPLPEEARQFLAMVVEMMPATTGSAPTYTGWWFDLFQHRIEDGLKPAALVADVYTSSTAGIAYLGVDQPRLGLFVVDRGGPPRVLVGPVATVYAHHGPLDTRLTDEAAAALPPAALEQSWAASYTQAAPSGPDLTLTLDEGGALQLVAGAPVAGVTVELLDHHRRSLARRTIPRLAAGTMALKFPAKAVQHTEALHLAAGGVHGWATISDVCACGQVQLGQKPAPEAQ